LDQQYEKQMADLHTAFRKQNAAAIYAGVAPQTVLPNPVLAGGSNSNMNNRMVTTSSSDHHGGMHAVSSSNDVPMAEVPQPSSNAPQFLQQLNTSLNQFWQDSLDQIQRLQDQKEQDFKNHNDLPFLISLHLVSDATVPRATRSSLRVQYLTERGILDINYFIKLRVQRLFRFITSVRAVLYLYIQLCEPQRGVWYSL
jgi:hypothetical protein